MTTTYPHYESHREALAAALASFEAMRAIGTGEGWKLSNLAWKTSEGIRRSFPGEFDR